MKHTRKLLALLMALALCLSLVPAAFAAGADEKAPAAEKIRSEKGTAAVEKDPAIFEEGDIVIVDGVDALPNDSYGLTVADVAVTDDNKNDILGDGGTFVFDGDHTLTVNGDCTTDTAVVKNTGIDGLVINVAADATLTSTETTCIYSNANFTITGKGKLTVDADNCGIFASGTLTLTIKDAYVDATGQWGICGNSSTSNEALVIDNSTVIAAGGAGAICDFGAGVALKSCEIITPAGGTLSSSAVCDAEGNEAVYAVISEDPNFQSEPVTYYGLTVAGTTVTSKNKDDVLRDGGTFIFDGDHTLIVSGDYSTDTNGIINQSIDGLVIDVAADATLTGSTGITIKANTTITGKGKLTLVSSSDCGIYATGTVMLTIKDAYVDATGKWGISGNSSTSNEALLIDGSTVIATGSEGAICDFGAGVTLKDCEILTPAGGTLSSSAVCDADGNEASYAVISDDPNFEPPAVYGLYVAGVAVTDENKDDILGDGVFSFDGDHTLTVRGNCYTSENAIYNEDVSGLVIDVKEDSVLYSSSAAGIYLCNDSVITGSGRLTTAGSCGIYVDEGAALTIRDAVVDASGWWGVAGNSPDDDEALTIDHATVLASGDSGAICDFGGGITVSNCSLVLPEGGSVGAAAVLDADGNDASQALIAVNPFTDVPESKYFFRPVMWAYYFNPQITSGVEATLFGPGNSCTREQIVTFLWKACGAPEPETTVNPFSDVKSGKYYFKAVLWAVENEITSGVGDGKFGVGQPCTREQAMTFLWKAFNSPEPETTENPFTDVKDGKYYFKAVLWAVENGITSGVDADKFGVGQTCTRGQIVTFLYKAMA